MNQSPTQTRQGSDQFAVQKRTDAKRDIITLLNSDSMKLQIAKALPTHMKADRMIRVMLTAINSNPKLQACTQTSLLSCLMKCSQYGLEPDGRHAHLIPFKEECTLIFDYKGLAQIVRRSGEVKNIHADVVYEGDEFSFSYGTGGHLRHVPTLDGKKRGAITAAYSFVVMASGEESFEVMSMDDVCDVRDNSQGYKAFLAKFVKTSPWETHFGEMAKKTAFRRHAKWLPFSFELQEKIVGDDDPDAERRFASAKPVKATDLGTTPVAEASDGLSQDIATAAETQQEPAQPTDANNPSEPEDNAPAQTSARARKPKPEAAPVTNLNEINPHDTLNAMRTAGGYSEAELMEAAVKGFKAPLTKSMAEWPDDYCATLVRDWQLVAARIKQDRAIG